MFLDIYKICALLHRSNLNVSRKLAICSLNFAKIDKCLSSSIMFESNLNQFSKNVAKLRQILESTRRFSNSA